MPGAWPPWLLGLYAQSWAGPGERGKWPVQAIPGPRGSGGALCWCLRGPERGGGHYKGNMVSGRSEPQEAQLRSENQDLLSEGTGRDPQGEEGTSGNGGQWAGVA